LTFAGRGEFVAVPDAQAIKLNAPELGRERHLVTREGRQVDVRGLGTPIHAHRHLWHVVLVSTSEIEGLLRDAVKAELVKLWIEAALLLPGLPHRASCEGAG